VLALMLLRIENRFLNTSAPALRLIIEYSGLHYACTTPHSLIAWWLFFSIN